MKNKTSILVGTRHFFYALIACVLLISCDSDKNRREKIGKQQIMIDQNKNYWLIKHSIGDNYIIQYLGDHTLYAR